MNWSSIGIGADVIAAIGVIVSLLYLARQIRAQAKETSLSATRDLARDWADMLRFTLGDEQNFDIYRRALHDYNGLSDDDHHPARHRRRYDPG